MLKYLMRTRFQMLLYSLSGAGKTDRFGRPKKGGKGGVIAIAITFPILFASYAYMLLLFFRTLATVADGLQMQWLHYAFAGGIAVLLSVFGSVFSTQSQLFQSKDNELLLSMPIKPRDVLLSRLLLVYLLNFLFTLLVLLPCGIAAAETFGTTGVGIAGYVLAAFLLPLLSTAICCLLGWLLSLLTARANNKAIINTLMTVAFLVVFYLVYFRFLKIAFNEDGNAIETITLLLTKLEGVFASYLAPFYWFGKLFAEGNVLCGLGALAVIVLPMVLAVVLISKSFYKITMSGSKVKKRVYLQKSMRVSGLRWALVRKELKHFSASAAYMTNCSMGILMLLAASVFLLIKRDLAEQLTILLPDEGVITLLAVLALCFVSFGNTITAPSVSLEGKNRWIVQSIPTDMSNVLLAKVDMHLILTAPVLLFASIVFAVCFGISGIGLVLLLVLPQVMNLLSALAGLWLNILMPKYEWASETVPVKQSAPVAIVLIGSMLYPMVLAGVYFIFLMQIISPFAMLGIFGGISVVLCAVLWLWIRKKGGARFIAAG